MQIKEVTVEELKNLYESGADFEIDTPDGWQKVISWWDKGILPMVEVVTPHHSTRCATNHLIQTHDGIWKFAEELDPGDVVKTATGDEEVLRVTPIDDEECFDFEIAHPNHRYWGDGFSSHNSGKSYILSANIVKACQEMGIYPILIDTENALDEAWLQALGVDTNEENCFKISGATVDSVTQTILEFIDDYLSEHGNKPYAERPKMLFIIDSLGMLISPTNVKQAEEGNMAGDMGIKAKQITQMMRVVLAKIASQPIGFAATNHVMDSQDKYQPDKIPGGKMLEFASSVIIQMNKYLLKEDEEGKKLASGEVAGIRSTAVVRKSRYAKPFEKIKIEIPYDKGMNAYSGLFDLFEKKNVIHKDGQRYTYTSPVTGEVFKDWRKNFRKEGILDRIMEEWSYWEEQADAQAIAVLDEDAPASDEE